jgi:predicted deacylase
MRSKMAAALSLAIAIPALALTLAGVNLEDHATVAGQTLVLNGAGLRKKLFIKVYVGGLYLPAKQSNAAAVLAADAPRRQVMHFLYSVSKDQMCDAWNEGLENNTKNASAEVKGAFKTLCNLMEPIPKGNRLILTYVPGTGTTVEVNGKNKGTLPGKATADAILATWIGPDPGPGQDFKKNVLGQ